jgi:tetratricopeptide (TPR) repeat protein
MSTETDSFEIGKRRLILRDSLAVLSLLFGTAVLFAVTLFLFRSFSAHRAVLAQYWSDLGAQDMRVGKPDDAIVALRTALSYAPGTTRYEQMLAQALGEAGHTEESYQYFMGLWDAQPGNGEVNLQLARLAAKRNDRPTAVNFYRASIDGTWEGDGVMRRIGVRLELARYLIANRDLPAARLELLIAGGNAPDDYDRDMEIGNLLEQAQSPADAWTYYQRASALRPDDPAAQEAAGRLAYRAGDYENAERLLARAHTERAESHTVIPQDFEDRTMMENAGRILELMPLPRMPAGERVGRILAARAIAKKRFDACYARFAGESPLPAALQALDTRWLGPDGTASADTLLRDAGQQDSAMQLVFDTEVQAEKLCGPATGDDALLLRLATNPHGITLPSLQASAQAAVPRD